MITIQCAPCGGGMILRAMGHAGYAPHGQDIVCAGVSALLQAYLDYLEALLPLVAEASLEVEEKEGLLGIRSEGFGGRDRDGFSVVEAGLRRLARRYPRHVSYGGCGEGPDSARGGVVGE